MAYTRTYLNRLKKEELIDLLLQPSDEEQREPVLKESILKTYLDEIIHISPDALLLINPEDMHLEACNQEALRLLDLESEDHLRKYLEELFRERPLFYELLKEISSTLSYQSDISMEVDFKTSEHQQRYGDLVCRNIEMLGAQYLLLRVVDITEIKKAQLRLMDSERQLEIAQEIARIGSYLYLQDQKEFHFSKAFFKLLDLEEGDPRPENMNTLQGFVHPDDREDLQQKISLLYKEKQDIRTEFRIISKKGKEKHLFCIIRVDMDEHGNINKLVGTLQDVTDRVLTEQKLRISEERYRLTVENTTDGVWYWNLRTYESYISPKYSTRLGFTNANYGPDAVYRWFERVHPDDKARLWEKYEACINGDREHFIEEFRYLDSQNRYLWIESRGTLIRDDEQRPNYLLGAMTNIQARKEAEFQLLEQEKVLNMAQRVARVGSWIWDHEKGIIEYSDELYHILELDTSIRGKMLGEEVIKRVLDEDKEKADRFLKEAKQLPDDEQQHIVELRMHLPSGKIKTLRTIGKAYQRTKEGRVAKLIGTTQDITEDKKREQELIVAKEQAEISRQAKDRFLQVVSHEIRNPLNAIVGITKLLEEADLQEREKEQVGTLKFSAGHLLSIINDILDTAKLQYGNIKLDNIPFHLHEQLTHAEELFSPLAADQETELRLEIDPAIPQLVVGDPVRFNQIVFNLLSNAVKHTYRGAIRMKVRLLNEKENSSELEIVVADTGAGISSENLEKIFEAFEQVDMMGHQQKGGTGLGLYIVRQLVNLMGGSINVQSDFGKGTSFTVMLSFGHAGHPGKSKPETGKQEQFDLSGKRVLYIEDATYNQLLLKGYAEVWNLQLDLAGNIKEALCKASQQQYDLILTDFRLPDGTGLDVANELRKRKIHQQTPLIVISAYQLEEKSEDYPFDDYIQKPINFDKFFYLLRKYLKKELRVPEKQASEPGHTGQGALSYLQQHQPDRYRDIVMNLEGELDELRGQLLQSIKTQNYRQYLLTVHKLSAALRMLEEDVLLQFLQNIDELPENSSLNQQLQHQVSSGFDNVIQKWKSERVLGK